MPFCLEVCFDSGTGRKPVSADLYSRYYPLADEKSHKARGETADPGSLRHGNELCREVLDRCDENPLIGPCRTAQHAHYRELSRI